MHISRRHLLKSATGATIALPFLESMQLSAAEQEDRHCLVAIHLPLGLYAHSLYPTELSTNTLDTEYLRPFARYHNRMSLISGLYHPGVRNGHICESRVFTGTPDSVGDPKTIPNDESFDQMAARYLGHKTRYSSLVLGIGNRGGHSWHANGMAVPPQSDMGALFNKLFRSESASDMDGYRKKLRTKNSVLDAVYRNSQKISPKLSSTDRDKLDEFLHAVQETERGIIKEEEWLKTPKPTVDADAYPEQRDDSSFALKVSSMMEMTYLALATDSTRIVSAQLYVHGNPGVEGANNGYHALSHHGRDPEMIRQLKIVESYILGEILRLVDRLDAVKEPNGKTLLDRTTVLITSNLGNGSSHSSKEMPLVLIGGGYNHGNHINYTPANETPMSNVYLTVLNHMGVPAERFSTSTGIVKTLV